MLSVERARWTDERCFASPDRETLAELHHAEAALRASEERFASAFEYAAIGMALLTPSGRFIQVNQAICTILGYSAAELLNLTFQDLTHPDDLDAELELAEIRQSETRYLHRSGRSVWALLTLSLVRDDQGTPLHFIAQIHDVSERKRAETALSEQDAIKLAMYDGTREALFVIDVVGPGDFRYADCNRTSEQVTGLRLIDLQGRSPDQVFEPEVAARLTANYMRCVEHGAHAYEWPWGTGADMRWMQTSLRALRDATNRVTRIVGVSIDITELKLAEERRLELERRVQYAQKLESLGLLAGGIAHDFNNLLTSVLGYSDLLQSLAPPSTVMRDYIDKVVASAKQAASLAQQMLSYSGKGRFAIEPVSLSALATDIGGLLDVSVGKKCTLDYRFSPDVPVIDADPTQIRQVIMNLILNAAEAMASRGGVITVRTGLVLGDDPTVDVEARLPAGRYALLEVSDQGCGMSEDTRRKIFDPFFTTKITGRGLGLAVVLGIVREHGGAIRVTSEPDRGTTFRVLLPASACLPLPSPASTCAPTGWKSSGTVLIVDDEESVRMLTRVMLQKMGFTVLTANDGVAGVALFRARAADIRLVLLDLTMPNLDGDQTFRAMREIQSDVRVILSSGYSEQGTSARFTGLGLAGFIQKPYRYGDLMAVCREVLET